MLMHKPPRSNKDTGLKVFELLIPSLKSHLNDWTKSNASADLCTYIATRADRKEETYKTRQTPSTWHREHFPVSSLARAKDPRHRCNSGIYARRFYPCGRSRCSARCPFPPSPEKAILDSAMRIQSHMFAARIVVNIIVRGANQLGVNCGGEAWLGFDGDVGHGLHTIGRETGIPRKRSSEIVLQSLTVYPWIRSLSRSIS